jgi:hypothetical protein
MTRIWQPETEFEVHLMFAEESAIEITYHFPPSEYEEFSKSLYTRIKLNRSSPAATLVLTLEDFNVDFFEWCGSAFVSERMRQAMALDPSEVRFYEVDDSKSATLPQSKNYQIMEPEVAEKALDLKRTEYQMRPILPEIPFVPFVTGRLALRLDAAPKHDLFYDSFFTKELFCTDTFALRVLRAGCTGLRFMDPNSRGDRNLFRTLRGIEESVGQDSNGVKITQVVEAID